MDVLTYENLVGVFSFLDSKDLVRAAQTNTLWNKVIKQNLLIEVASVRNKLTILGHSISDALIYQIIKLNKLNLINSLELLLEYVEFRREEFGKVENPKLVIKKEIQTYKAFWSGHDKQGRPCLIIRPKFHIPSRKNHTLLYAIHMFEYACEIVWRSPYVKNFCVILDFDNFGTANFDASFARTFITWSRKYYKNLLAECYCIRSPKYALWCWKIVKVFIPAETLKKIHIFKNEAEGKKILSANFDPNQLPEAYGGSARLPKRYQM